MGFMVNSFDSKPKSENGKEDEEESPPIVVLIPTIEYFQKTYGGSCEGDDRKAVQLFADYEAQEKLRRLQQQLIMVRDGRVSEKICHRVIGKKRVVRHESYQGWARLMLQWIASRKR